MNRNLVVWWDEDRVGSLYLDENGDLSFIYDSSWLAATARPAISVSLPKRAEAFNRRDTRPFFAGVLPDEDQRDAVARALGVSRQNDFGLLEALGGDIAGALSLWAEGEEPPGLPNRAPPPTALTDDALIETLDALPRRPFLVGKSEGMRMSLAGAQQKLPVVLVDGAIALPTDGQPTTHILKPPIDRFPGTTGNEAFAMRLAAAVGLAVAPVELRRVRGRTFMLVERYDRDASNGPVRRLHQEDFCQALGVTPEHKYASEGGPGFRDCFDLVRRSCARPAQAALQLLDAAIFNVVVGNADAHGKNYSLLYSGRELSLAPLYDLMCTAAYPDVSPNLAMRVGKRSTLDDFRPDTWDQFAESIGIRPPYVRRRVAEVAALAAGLAADVARPIAEAGFDPDVLRDVVRIVRARADRVTALLA